MVRLFYAVKKAVSPVGCARYASLSALLFPPYEKFAETLSRKKAAGELITYWTFWCGVSLSIFTSCAVFKYSAILHAKIPRNKIYIS